MSYLTEAFKALDALNEETFDVSADGIKKLADFENIDDNVDETTIFDMDAETEDDIEDSYVGKVIIDCNVCHSKIYKDKDEVVIDDETNNANVDMECPYCYSTDGFKVIGEVAPMNTETEEKVEDDIKESLNEATTLQFTDDYEYDTLSAIEDDNITLFNKLKNYPELIKGDEVIIPKGTKLIYDRTDEYYKYYKLPEYGNLRIRILADEYTDFSHHIGTSDETFAKYVDKLNSGVRRFSVKWADVKDFEKYLKDHNISYDTGYGGKASVPFIIKSKVKNESLNEATVTDYKGSLSNILVKNKDKISKMTTKGEIVKFLDSITDEVRDKNYLETVKSNMQKKNDFGAVQYIYSIILAGERKRVKESVTEGFKEEDESVNKDLLWAFRKLLREHPQTDIVFTSSYTKDGEIILEPTSYEDFDNLHLLKIDNALNSKDYQISTNKHLYILDKDAFIRNGKIHIPYEVEDPEEDPDDIDYVYKWDDDKDDKLEVPSTTYSENDIRQKVYEIVTEDLDLDYDTIDSTKQGNTVIVTVYGNEEEFEDEEVDSLVDELSEYLENKAKVRAHINRNYDMVIKVILPNGMLVENIQENIGTDIDEYQQWVDYDMKRYGKISNQTNKEIKEAGLQVVKDKYGDYQVIAGKYDESLKECVKDVTITTDDSKTTMTSEDNGKVTVTTEPVEDEHFEDKEVIKTLDNETIQDIETNSIDDESEEDDDNEEETEFAENEFNESFSKLCENYLKENYSNVESFKATKSTHSPKQIIVEGLIKFTSGKVKNTKFSFNENISTNNHKGFQGKNLNITNDKAPFLLKTNSKMVCEALSYNYRTKNDENKKVRCKGIVKEG